MSHVATTPHPDPLRSEVELLSGCDREAIHIPGSIQPHGLLLVVDPTNFEVTAGAGDLERHFGSAWLGCALPELLGQTVGAIVDARPASSSFALKQVQGATGLFDAIAHRSGDALLVELEPSPTSTPSPIEVLSVMDEAAATFEQAFGLQELCERAAKAFRQLTGFDRVMLYRFLDDDAGVVLAEDRDPALGTFLNQHFPATDIPKQARALYVRNRVRIIPDVSYHPAPLRPAPAQSLDLSDIGLRSVSPVHLQYLKNMGVAASASVSIVRDGQLWGLIACHHPTPKFLPLHIRMTCRALAGSLSRQIKAKEDAELYRERIRLRTAEDTVLQRLGSDLTLEKFFGTAGEDLCRMLGADSFAAVRDSQLYSVGRAPPDAGIREVAAYVSAMAGALPYTTDRLAEELPSAAGFADLASGVLAVNMSIAEPTILMWFRAEKIEVVNWAGNPHKDIPADPMMPLSPRASFDTWSEAVSGRSAPWTLFEIEAATRLKRTMFEVRQNRRLFEVNRELTATIADNETLLAQKDYLIREVHHRVQNSLQLVSAFLGLQGRAVGDATLSAHLAEAQRRLSAVAMVHRRLHSDDQVHAVDLARYINDLCREIESSMDDSWKGQITLDLAPVLLLTERAVHIGLILTELVINANKYAYGGKAGPIAIGLEQHRNQFRLTVADRGAGKTGGREGFGSRMLRAMVKRLSGTIEEFSNEPGLRVVVTVPIKES